MLYFFIVACWKLFVLYVVCGLCMLVVRVCLLIPFSWVIRGGSLTRLGLSGATGFRYHVKALCCKREHLLAKIHPSLPHWCLQGGIPLCLYLAFCNLFLSFFIWSDGGCWWDKGSWRRLIFKRTSVICRCRQSALSFAPVKEGSQRFKGQHCLCSAMLNHFWLETILKLGL